MPLGRSRRICDKRGRGENEEKSERMMAEERRDRPEEGGGVGIFSGVL